jgi:Fic family protein
MTWNWEQPDWPTFLWDRVPLEAAEKHLLVSGGVFLGTLRHLGSEERGQLAVEAMSTEAVTTSGIEGEILDRASVECSIRKQLGLAADERWVRPAERGIAEMIVDLYRSFHEPLSEEMLFRWHRMVMNGRRDLGDVGRYRIGAEPMQVVSRTMSEPKVHFEAPPSSRACSGKAQKGSEAGSRPENTAPSPGRHRRRPHGTWRNWLPRARWFVRVNGVTPAIISLFLSAEYPT